MKKTSTRLATLGGIVVLGAFSIVLAQNDARKREREQPTVEPVANQAATPIQVDETEIAWRGPSTTPPSLVVRANNDQSVSYGNPDVAEESNPLRDSSQELVHSEVILASAGSPIEPPSGGLPTTSKPPSWLGDGAAGASNNTEQPAALPTLPSFPISSAAPGQTSNGVSPSMVAPTPALPPIISSGVSDMSDTQRGAMQPTNLLPAADLQASPFPPGLATAPNPAPLQNLATPQANIPSMPAGMRPPERTPFAGTQPPPQPGSLAADVQGLPQPMPSAFANNGASHSTSGPSGPRPSPSESNNGLLRTAGIAGLVSNQPGNRYLDGSQNPNMVIQKRAPEEIQVGKKATFVISVRNAGNATAHEVRVIDKVPQGSHFVESVPPVSPDANGDLVWHLGEMAAGDEKTITLQIVPEVQGEVGSNALVYFGAQASVRTVATLPKLELQLHSQPEMLISSRQQVSVVVKNTGTGVARAVRLEADIPQQLKHDSGEAQLAASLGDLRPNEVQAITLDLTAVQPGQSAVAIRAASDDGALAEESLALAVLAPQLTATIEGPKLRYLDRQASYKIKVTNTGTTAASNLLFVAHLPVGLNFISANNHGQYDSSQHVVRWGLEELLAGDTAPVELTVLPVELGAQAIAVLATGDLGLKAEAKGIVTVDGLADIEFKISQDNGTIETGSSTTYAVQISNNGNKPDKDVRLAVLLPNGSKLLAVDAQVNYRAEGNQLVFDPVAEMRNNDQYTYRFQVQHNQAGTQIVRAKLTSTNWPVEVIKEEGTLVYDDQN